MKELVILITMFFVEPQLPDAVEVEEDSKGPLVFTSYRECFNYVDKHVEGLKKFGMTVYPKAVAVRTKSCVEKN